MHLLVKFVAISTFLTFSAAQMYEYYTHRFFAYDSEPYTPNSIKLQHTKAWRDPGNLFVYVPILIPLCYKVTKVGVKVDVHERLGPEDLIYVELERSQGVIIKFPSVGNAALPYEVTVEGAPRVFCEAGREDRNEGAPIVKLIREQAA